uniref:BTB domain-containing protein n=1 Tax=Caenorhabditis tropicalis TaxID=1561998 RepID=A0A1I7TGR1_9PELO
MSYDLKLLSVTGKSKVYTINKQFNDKESAWGNVITWEEMEKDYMIDGDVIIEAHANIIRMTGIEKKKLRNFNEIEENISDTVLIVNNEKFCVSKMFLSSQSSEFKNLFSENTEQQSEIILNDVDSKGFQHFLECLYGEDSIDEETAAGILKIADAYNAKIPLQKCENFLIRDSGKTLKKKLQLANQFKLNKLKNECLSKINTATEIRSVLTCDLNEMDPSVVGTLLQKVLVLTPFT